MRKLLAVLLATSLVAFVYGVMFDMGRLVTGAMVFSGCMAGTLAGDTIRRRKAGRSDVLAVILVLGGLGVLMLSALVANQCLHLGWFPVSMSPLATATLFLVIFSVVLSLGLTWRMQKREKEA